MKLSRSKIIFSVAHSGYSPMRSTQNANTPNPQIGIEFDELLKTHKNIFL